MHLPWAGTKERDYAKAEIWQVQHANARHDPFGYEIDRPALAGPRARRLMGSLNLPLHIQPIRRRIGSTREWR